MKKYLIFLGVMVSGVLIGIFIRLNSPRSEVQNALGITLPTSATEIQMVYRWLPDSKVIELWAVMQMSREDTKELAVSLGVPLETYPFGLPTPKSIPVWWKDVTVEKIAATTNRWLLEGPDLRPAKLGVVWIDGKVFIYKLGMFGLGQPGPKA
jgi:hypothetical protein